MAKVLEVNPAIVLEMNPAIPMPKKSFLESVSLTVRVSAMFCLVPTGTVSKSMCVSNKVIRTTIFVLSLTIMTFAAAALTAKLISDLYSADGNEVSDYMFELFGFVTMSAGIANFLLIQKRMDAMERLFSDANNVYSTLSPDHSMFFKRRSLWLLVYMTLLAVVEIPVAIFMNQSYLDYVCVCGFLLATEINTLLLTHVRILSEVADISFGEIRANILSLEDTFREDNRESREFKPEQIHCFSKTVSNLYTNACGIVNDISHVYGTALIFTYVQYITYIILSIYTVIVLAKDVGIIAILLVVYDVFLFAYFVNLCMALGKLPKKATLNINKLLHLQYGLHESDYGQIGRLLSLMSTKEHAVSASGYFSFTDGLLSSMAGIVLMYVVIMIQFRVAGLGLN